MRRLYTFLIVVFITAGIFAQSPQKISYQAVIRNSLDQLVASHLVGMRISILQGTETGTAVYVETQISTTNTNGLIFIKIGEGAPVYGTFSDIDWSAGPYFLKTETDPDGGTSYSIEGTSQMLSVPYALHSKTAQLLSGGSHYLGEEYFGGIIFYLYTGNDGQQHGLVVSKTETTGIWSGSTLVGSNRSEDGYYNTILIPSGSTAKIWVEGLGTNWYLPSIDELSLLWNNRFHVNQTARAIGSTLLSYSASAYYWSSTEYNAINACYFLFGNGAQDYNSKTDTYSVRAIRAF